MTKFLYVAPRLALYISIVSGPLVSGNAQEGEPQAMEHGNMGHMAGHMYMTPSRPERAGDRRKADDIVAKARLAMEPYMDYHKALADGFRVNNPEIKRPQYHFTSYSNAAAAARHFDPLRPTSLLYKSTSDGGFKLVGVMYTARQMASEGELDKRVPLSIAHWHEHINFCKGPTNDRASYIGPNARFGLQGSIINQRDCEAAGGTFRPHIYGWMVHVYPFETDPAKRWSLDDDDEGHDNMDRSAMPDMKMD